MDAQPLTLSEIHRRLAQEFPGRNVSFKIEVNTYRYSNGVTDDPDLKAFDIELWDSEFGTLLCADFNDGVQQLKLRLGKTVPEMELVV